MDTEQKPVVKPVIESRVAANQWAMFTHLSILVGLIVPVLGLVVPLLIWQFKKNDYPTLDSHGKNVMNWIISLILYLIISTILVFIVIGVFMLVFFAVISVIFPIIGAIKANNGEVWRYPMSIRFIK